LQASECALRTHKRDPLELSRLSAVKEFSTGNNNLTTKTYFYSEAEFSVYRYFDRIWFGPVWFGAKVF